MAAGGENG